jgi:hypothetical protein
MRLVCVQRSCWTCPVGYSILFFAGINFKVLLFISAVRVECSYSGNLIVIRWQSSLQGLESSNDQDGADGNIAVLVFGGGHW